MVKKFVMILCLLSLVACNRSQQTSSENSKITFYSDDYDRIEIHPDSITKMLTRCVDKMEEDNPYVISYKEECKYEVSFFLMEDSISKIAFLFSSNSDGTDITMIKCIIASGQKEYICPNIQKLEPYISFIVYPELDGHLMRNFK